MLFECVRVCVCVRAYVSWLRARRFETRRKSGGGGDGCGRFTPLTNKLVRRNYKCSQAHLDKRAAAHASRRAGHSALGTTKKRYHQ